MTQAQRQIVGSLYAFYNEAVAARAAVDLARSAADLAAESLRLVNLRYQAGSSTVLEVVDAQNTLIEARNTYDESQVRYRVSIASLQSVTGGSSDGCPSFGRIAYGVRRHVWVCG